MCYILFFFFNDTAPTEISTLSLHDALPISRRDRYRGAVSLLTDGADEFAGLPAAAVAERLRRGQALMRDTFGAPRSEEHTSELQSRQYLVCRLLLEKKKKQDEQARVQREEL